MAAMSLRGPLVAELHLYNCRTSSLRAKGREGVVDAQVINKETLENSSDCRHDDDDDSTFVSGDVDPRRKVMR